jgi:hypothetical protein
MKKKLSKIQRQWVSSFNAPKGMPWMHLLFLLNKLKVLSHEQLIYNKDLIIDNIAMWQTIYHYQKLLKNQREKSTSHYDNRPPKKLKSDTKYR